MNMEDSFPGNSLTFRTGVLICLFGVRNFVIRNLGSDIPMSPKIYLKKLVIVLGGLRKLLDISTPVPNFKESTPPPPPPWRFPY